MKMLIVLCALVLFTGPARRVPPSEGVATVPSRIYIEQDSAFLSEYTRLVNTAVTAGFSYSGYSIPFGEVKKRLLTAVTLRKKHEYTQAYSLLMQDALVGIPSALFYMELARNATAAGTTENCLALLRTSDRAKPFFPFLRAALFSLAGKSGLAADTLTVSDASVFGNSPFYYLFRAEVLRKSGQYQAAAGYPDSAMYFAQKIYGTVPAFIHSAIAGEQGNIFWYTGKIEEALQHYKQRLQLALVYGLTAEKTRAQIGIAVVLDRQNNPGKARLLFDEALQTAQQLGEDDLLAYAYMESGVGYTYSGDYPKAVKQYHRAKELYKKTGNFSRLALLADNLGRHYLSLGALGKARESFYSGLEYDEDAPASAAQHSLGLGDVYTAAGNYTKALTWYTKAEAYAEKIQDAVLSAEIAYGIGSMCYYAGNSKTAVRYWKSVVELFPTHNDQLLAGLALLALSTEATDRDSLSEAERLYVDAKKHLYPGPNSALLMYSVIDRARAYLSTGNISKAAQMLSDLPQLSGSEYVRIQALRLLAEAEIFQAQGNNPFATIKASAALQAAQKERDFELTSECYTLLAQLSAVAGKHNEAGYYFNEAITGKENIEQILFPSAGIQVLYNERRHDVYAQYIRYLLNRGDVKQAFLIIERERSRSTYRKLLAMRLEGAGEFSTMLDQVLEARWLLHSSLVTAEESDSLQKYIWRTESQLCAEYPELLPVLQPEDITISRVTGIIPQGTLYLSLYYDGVSTVVFGVSGETVVSNILPWKQKDLEERLSAISPYYFPGKENAPLTADLFAFHSGASYQLYKELLFPILQRFPNIKKLLITPSGLLAGFPFEMLVTGGNMSSDYRYDDKTFISDGYSVSYTPSIKLFGELYKRDDVFQGEYLAIGNPVLQGMQKGFSFQRGLLDELPGAQRGVALLPLKYSELELDEIAAMLPAVRLLSKQDATEDNFRKHAVDAKLIHISTHSALLQNLPVIFFSPEQLSGNDGALEAAEVAGLQLKADLVTLSSCQSGSGLATVTEGITGMTKAFFESGAKSVVVSLWEVNDRYTATFMKYFYEELGNGTDKATALQQAKIRFRKEVNANPYYWGAFVLSGKTTPLLQVSGIEQYRSLFLLSFLSLFLSVTAAWFVTAKRKKITASI